MDLVSEITTSEQARTHLGARRFLQRAQPTGSATENRKVFNNGFGVRPGGDEKFKPTKTAPPTSCQAERLTFPFGIVNCQAALDST